jgi:integrase
MSYLEQRSKRSYRLTWYENGEPQRESFKASTFEEAKEIQRKKDLEIERKKLSQLTLAELWERYKMDRPRRNNQPHEESYINRAYEFFGENIIIPEIDKNAINEWRNWLLKQPNKSIKKGEPRLISTAYANKCLRILRAVWNYGEEAELYDLKYPFKGVKFPKEKRKDIVLSWKQVDNMINIAKAENPLEAEYLELLARTAIRRGELYKLKWNDILENQIILRQAKSDGTDQTIPNWPQFKETLTNIHNQSDPVIDYVWSDGNGQRLKLETITDLVQRYLKKIGVKEKGVGAHVLRHSFTTINLERGVPIEKIAILLRHKTTRMTEIYSHLKLTQEDGAAFDYRHPLSDLKLFEPGKQ